MADKSKGDVDQTKVVTTASGVRIETPKSNRQHKPKVTVTIDDINPASGFVDWLRANAVVGLAIGFVIGTQVQLVVKQLISSFIDPLFVLLFGQQLTTRSFTLHFSGRSASFTWGTFVYSLINFIFLLLAIFLIIKFLKLDKLDKPKK